MNKRYTFPALFAFLILLFTTSSHASLITSSQQSNSVIWTIVQAGFPVEKVVLTVTGPDPTTSSCAQTTDCSHEFPSGISPVFDISNMVAGSYSWLVEIIIDTSSCDQTSSRELQGGLQGLADAPIQTYLDCLASLNFPDSADLSATGTFLVTVAGDLIAPLGPDLTQPFFLTAPGDLSVEASAVLTAVAIGSANATTEHPPVTISNDAPVAGYELGDTTVTWTGVDDIGEIAVDIQLIMIVDTTPPVLVTVPGDISQEASDVLTLVDIGLATASDIFDVTVTNDVPTAFPLGTTLVIWAATDTSGNSVTGIQSVTIVDTTAPVFAFTQHGFKLQPPNHKMVLVATVNNITDLADPNPVVSILVTSNQPINGTGDGNTEADWEVVQDGDSWLVYVRAERSGNQGARVYDIAVSVTDFSGNVATVAGAVTVPHDNRKKN